MNRLAILELNDSYTAFTELECEVAFALTIDIVAMPLLLTILIISSKLTVEYCVSIITKINKTISTFSL